jgi:hypothetical protein
MTKANSIPDRLDGLCLSTPIARAHVVFAEKACQACQSVSAPEHRAALSRNARARTERRPEAPTPPDFEARARRTEGQPGLQITRFGAVPRVNATAETTFRGNQAPTQRIKSPLEIGGAS